MLIQSFISLPTEITMIIISMAIIGPIIIGILIYVLKKIENKNPDRIRWR